MTKKSGLGRGFDALLPQSVDMDFLDNDADRIKNIPVLNISPDKGQPRKSFDQQALVELAGSIKQFGIVQPLVVRKEGKAFVIVAGERRWRAAQIAGLETVPVIVRSLQELERLEIAIVENVQRVDLSPIEQAISIERLHEQFSMDYTTIAKRLGKALSTVTNIVRLLQLPKDAREALESNEISEGHARAVLSLKDFPEKQAELLDSIRSYGWSVRQAERFATSIKQGVVNDTAVKARVNIETPETKRLSERLGVPVAVRRTAKGGRIELVFKSDEQLEKLIELLDGSVAS